ncbi:conserved hypothetical protein, partial [Ricinus communis]
MQRTVRVAPAAQQRVVDGPRPDALDREQALAHAGGVVRAVQRERAVGDEAGEAQQRLRLCAGKLTAGQVLEIETGHVGRFRIAPQAARMRATREADERAAQGNGERQVDLLADDGPRQRLEHGGGLDHAQARLARDDGAEQRVIAHRVLERRGIDAQAEHVHEGVVDGAVRRRAIAGNEALGAVRMQHDVEQRRHAVQQHALADAARLRIDDFGQRIGIAAVERKSVRVAIAGRQRDRVAAHLPDAVTGATRPKRGTKPVTNAVPTR